MRGGKRVKALAVRKAAFGALALGLGLSTIGSSAASAQGIVVPDASVSLSIGGASASGKPPSWSEQYNGPITSEARITDAASGSHPGSASASASMLLHPNVSSKAVGFANAFASFNYFFAIVGPSTINVPFTLRGAATVNLPTGDYALAEVGLTVNLNNGAIISFSYGGGSGAREPFRFSGIGVPNIIYDMNIFAIADNCVAEVRYCVDVADSVQTEEIHSVLTIDPAFAKAGFTLVLSPGISNSTFTIPEPSTWFLTLLGLFGAGLANTGRRKFRKNC
jgi:hypothetical protein